MKDSTLLKASRIQLSEPGCYVLMYQRGDRFELPKVWREGVDEVYVYFAAGFEAIVISKPENTPLRVRKIALKCKMTSWNQIHIPYNWTIKLWKSKVKNPSTPGYFFCYSLQDDDSLALTYQSAQDTGSS